MTLRATLPYASFEVTDATSSGSIVLEVILWGVGDIVFHDTTIKQPLAITDVNTQYHETRKVRFSIYNFEEHE